MNEATAEASVRSVRVGGFTLVYKVAEKQENLAVVSVFVCLTFLAAAV